MQLTLDSSKRILIYKGHFGGDEDEYSPCLVIKSFEGDHPHFNIFIPLDKDYTIKINGEGLT